MTKLAYLVGVAISLGIGSAGCFGVVSPSPNGTDDGTPNGAPTNPRRDDARAPHSNAAVSSTTPAPACKAEPWHPNTQAPCDVAKQFLVVEPLGISWTSGSPWQADAKGLVHVRYRNDSPTQFIDYPALALSSSDERVEGESGSHLAHDGHFHPDFYGLSSCDREETAQPFVVHQTLPRGTRVEFVLTPAVADGNGISTCNDTLPVVPFDVDVP